MMSVGEAKVFPIFPGAVRTCTPVSHYDNKINLLKIICMNHDIPATKYVQNGNFQTPQFQHKIKKLKFIKQRVFRSVVGSSEKRKEVRRKAHHFDMADSIELLLLGGGPSALILSGARMDMRVSGLENGPDEIAK